MRCLPNHVNLYTNRGRAPISSNLRLERRELRRLLGGLTLRLQLLLTLLLLLYPPGTRLLRLLDVLRSDR